ncbi:MFS transporter [Pacificimonas flava]|uniref:Sugar transporter n=1 Tax=Pacificimonas flava TaxID=1234595 RepID=M2T8K3_9SPHN|nr:MFS transporter [Pacificimonas flava]EMD82829.1 hypothetical protein C725_1869 [Pacificimonas flava]MBB5279444.1 Na+/melibiose symporter-like transporter [Pacificimonas flava]
MIAIGTAAADTPPPIKLSTKLFYGAGSIGYGIKDVAFRTFLLVYYNQVIGVRAELVSLAILVALVVDAISDPLVGQLSDNLRTRWGRRHPLMFASAIPAAGSLLFLFLPPAGLNDVQMFFYILVVGCAVRTFITFYEIPSSALAPELTSEYDERTSIASFRYFFGYLGGVGISFLTLLVFLKPTEAFPVGQLNPAGYWTFAITGAALMLASILVSSFGTLHRVKYFRPQPVRERVGMRRNLAQMRESFSHRGFLAILGFGMLKYTAIGMTGALILYFGTYLWRLNSNELAILALDSLMGAFLGLFLAPWASRRFGKRNAALGLTVIAVFVGAMPYVLRLSGLFFSNDSPYLIPALFTLVSIYSACGVSSAILVHAMVGDVVEESQLSTGRRTEGLFYAANTFMQKAVSGIGVFAAGLLVAAVGLEPGTDPATLEAGVAQDLALIYVPMLVFLYVAGAACLLFYKIDRTSHEANLRALEERDRRQAANADMIADPAD